MGKVNFTMLFLRGLRASEKEKLKKLLFALKDGEAKVTNVELHDAMSWTIETEEIG